MNAIVFSLGGALAFASLILPRLIRQKSAGSYAILIFFLYGSVFGICHCVFGIDVATAVVVLAGLLTCDMEALVLQYHMMHFPKSAKFIRCY